MKRITVTLMSIAIAIASFISSASSKGMVAITFDDGPNTDTTPLVLDVLAQNKAKATFFLIGNYINETTIPVMKRAVKMGCTLQNHSRTHSINMHEFSGDSLLSEINFTSDAIKNATGKAPKFYRPPYINVNSFMHATIPLTFICGRGAEDWLPEVSAEERARRILDTIHDGEIILLHDFQNNTATVEALKIILPELKRRGFECVTLEKLFKKKGVKLVPYNGVIYNEVVDLRKR